MERIPLKANSTGKMLILVTLAMLALGLVMVHSAVASVESPGLWYRRVDLRHTAFALLSAATLLLGWRFDYRWLRSGRRGPVLAGSLLAVAILCGALVFVPGVGKSVGGCYRWIRIGPPRYAVGFQPSELIKISLVVFLAAWLSRKPPTELCSFGKTFLPSAGLVILCVGLVATQDFGSATLIGIAAGATMLLAGVPIRQLAMLIPPAMVGFYGLVVRVPHRWARITAMLDPWASDNPSAYQPQQSLMAILSGGWFGKGTGCGIRKLGYLPEDSTDFIFSVFCEEWGFIGAALLISLVVLWIFAARRASVRSSDCFGQLLAGSLGFMIGLQAVLHIAVVLAAAPPTGVSLPFVSAGGTALVLLAGATALMVSVTSRPGAASFPPGLADHCTAEL